MLSHRTTQANEALAFQRMWDRFGSWKRSAMPARRANQAIRSSNYPETKAPRIQEALRQIIAERGEPSIDFLRDLPAGEGLVWLMKLPGVGIKTASLVLLFCFSKPVLPVDTHVHRVSQRVGLIGKTVGPTPAHAVLLRLLPDDPYVLFNFHVALLPRPADLCVEQSTLRALSLPDICNWYQENRARKRSS